MIWLLFVLFFIAAVAVLFGWRGVQVLAAIFLVGCFAAGVVFIKLLTT
jgi:hypothetical protein